MFKKIDLHVIVFVVQVNILVHRFHNESQFDLVHTGSFRQYTCIFYVAIKIKIKSSPNFPTMYHV